MAEFHQRVRGSVWVPLAVVMAVGALALPACGTSSTTAASGQTRTVLVDYNHDETALSAFAYFPQRVAVRPGDTVEFKQAWTGEPHSVTMGTYVDTQVAPIMSLLERVAKSGDIPAEEPEEFQKFSLPYAFGEGDDLAQNAAQPCYVEEADFTGEYPGDETTPCKKRAQPAFSGQPIYSSGIIPFEGVGGNTFKVRLADDLATGTYSFYCNVHGALQWGAIDVKPKGSEIPSAGAVAKQARKEAERFSAPFVENYRFAKAGKPVSGGEPGNEETIETKGKNLVGLPIPFFKDGVFFHGVSNEFAPRSVKAEVGKPVTWTMLGGHTLSFNVPKYFPVFTVAKDGKVALNPKATPAAGWDEPPEPPSSGDESEGGGEEEGPPPEPRKVEVTWDGKGFHSTGMSYNAGDTFSVTFTKAGTYPFACLIHPQMVGKVVVSS